MNLGNLGSGLLKFFNSNLGQTVASKGIDAVGAGLNARASNKQADIDQAYQQQQLAQNQRQFDANFGQNQQQFDANLAQRNQQLALDASAQDPLSQQKSRANMALLASLIGNARNIQPPAGLEGFTPTGGMRIPEGGFGPDVMNFLTPQARASGEQQQRAAAGALLPPMDYSTVGYGDAGREPTSRNRSWYESELAKIQGSQNAILGAITPGANSQSAKTARRNWLPQRG